MTEYKTYEYKGLLVTYSTDGRYYKIEDFSKVLNEPVNIGGGSSDFSQFTPEYINQLIDELVDKKDNK